MKKIFLMCFAALLYLNSTAQDAPPVTGNEEQKEKIAQTIEALKTAYITKDLGLSPEEAQKFWPVYNNFADEIKKARIEHKDDDIAFEEKKVAIMKRYRENFRKILNGEDRVKRCFRVEPEFHKLLRREWQIRQNRGQGIKRPNGPGPNRGGQPIKPGGLPRQ